MFSPTTQDAPRHTEQIQRPGKNLGQKQAVYNRKISAYFMQHEEGTNISRWFGVHFLGY